ncbi:MAG: GNAT family N-acetyltransferase [Nitrospiraceae bacterium]|nr:GNAT family N-acetyltransferase [Nitrospiraceae bacterium]
MLTVTRLATDGEFSAVGNEWNALLRDSKQHDLLLTHEWFTMCRRWFCSEHELYVLIVRQDGRLVGFAPLQIRRVMRCGITLRQLCFLHESLPWYRGDFVVADESDQVLAAMLAYLSEHRQDWDLARFEGVAEQSRTVAALPRLGLPNGLSLGAWESFNQASVMPIQREWEDFLHSCGVHFRKHLRNNENRLRRAGALEFHCTREPAEVDRQLRIVYSLQEDNHRHKQEQSPESDRVSAEAGLFLGKEFSRSGAAEVRLMTVDGKPVAGWFSVDLGRTSFALVTKHNVQFAKHSPGMVMMQEYLRDTWRSGADRIDCLMTWPYVQRWTSHAERYLKIECFHEGARSRLLRGARVVRDLLRPRATPTQEAGVYD